MKKLVMFLIVCCLVVSLMGCGYAVVRTGSVPENYGDNGKGHLKDEVTTVPAKEEIVGTIIVPLDVRQNLFVDGKSEVPGKYNDGVLTLEGKGEEKGVGIIYTLPIRDNRAQVAKLTLKGKGEGIFFVLNSDENKGAGQQKIIFYLAGDNLAGREFTLSPLEKYLQAGKKEGQEFFELCVEVEKGKTLEISQIKVDFLSVEPETKTIVKEHYGEQPPIPEVVRYCHQGPVYVYNPYGYYDVYYDWWFGSRWIVWRNNYYSSVVYYWPSQRVYYYHYYYPSTSVNVYCEPSPRVRCAPSARNTAPRQRRTQGSRTANHDIQEGKNTSKNVASSATSVSKGVLAREITQKNRNIVPQKSQEQSNGTSWLGRLASKGKERITQGGRSEVPLKRNESSASQNAMPARRQGLTEAVQKAASRVRETQPQRQVQA
ncbi:hypothetical protein KJ656_17920, partial [bacterium]|nr:hypothetical protein [bacterium]